MNWGEFEKEIPTATSAIQPDIPKLDGLCQFWQFSIDQYHRMIASGVLEEGSPVELIEGFVVSFA